MLWVIIDATITLGPVSLSLLGFGIGVPMSKLKLNKLSTLISNELDDLIKAIEWRISGLGVSFEKPPLILAGVFEHEIAKLADATTKESYRGGIAVTFPPYVFVAVGEYSIITSSDGKDVYKSIFIFAKLDGPLVELEFARISGIRLGFGYNSAVRSPSTEELFQFPFVNDSGLGNAGNNPAKILASMTKGVDNKRPWVESKRDAYWFALGLTITAFEVLSVTAVAMLGFKSNSITVSIYADAIAQLPAKQVPKEACILYVELLMVAEMNFGEGYFRVEAALAPTSFILVPQCQLYGGFALCYWFGPNEHAGDFVFTIGGYHPAFSVPAWYPPVKRLGIAFTVGNNISIRGEGYFAITPQVAMGGARIHVSLDVGPVSAYLDASFDAMINFRPLHYVADMRVSIGVTFDADILFIHIHISVHVGADLHIEGPEFGGKAHVDFYLFAFDVYFGATNRAPPPISLLEFWNMVHKPGPDQGVVAESDPKSTKYSDPEMNNIKFTLEDGAFVMPQRDSKPATATTADPSPNSGAGTLWNVKGGTFQFRISTDMALSQANVTYPNPDAQPNESAEESRELIPVEKLGTFYAKPMQLNPSKGDKPISSVLNVTVRSQRSHKPVPEFQIKYVHKDMPTSVWGPYSPDQDPNIRKASPDELLKGIPLTMDLAMGISLHSPPPKLERSKIPDFNATAMAKLEVPRFVYRNEKDELIVQHWNLPDTEDLQTQYLPKFIEPSDAARPNAAKWEEIRSTWTKSYQKELVEGAAGKPGEGMLSILGSTLGWDSGLTAGVPTRLVGEKEGQGLVQYYLGLPRVTEG